MAIRPVKTFSLDWDLWEELEGTKCPPPEPQESGLEATPEGLHFLQLGGEIFVFANARGNC